MICPRCGTQNALGTRRCANCLMAFTRGAADRDLRSGYGGPSIVPTTDGDVSDNGAFYPDYPLDARRGRRGRYRLSGCLVALGILATTLAIVAVLFMVTSNALIKPMVLDAADAQIRSGVREEISGQLATHTSLSAANGEAVTGEITVTQAEINERIAANGDLGPFDDVAVELVDGGVSVQLRAYGLSGSYDADLRVENGSLVLDGGDIDGPLGLLAPSDELEAAVNEEIAASLVSAGYRVDAVSVHDGRMVVVVGALGE
ncbi:MAG: hypothetical protein DCC58_14630 [Chloroflexi bacterium]|nr:MAG: hypothetical protein DCC58_14630 [Chloroflexota bacterium]